jgi:hypothetical protein
MYIDIYNLIRFDLGDKSPKPVEAKIVTPEKNRLINLSRPGSGKFSISSSVTQAIVSIVKRRFRRMTYKITLRT